MENNGVLSCIHKGQRMRGILNETNKGYRAYEGVVIWINPQRGIATIAVDTIFQMGIEKPTIHSKEIATMEIHHLETTFNDTFFFEDLVTMEDVIAYTEEYNTSLVPKTNTFKRENKKGSDKKRTPDRSFHYKNDYDFEDI